MSRKTRQTVTILALCVLLIAAGIGYYALLRYQSSQEDSEEQEGISLYQMDDSKIVGLRFKNSKAEMDFIKEKDTWLVEGDTDFPLDQNKITTMVDEVAAVTADKLVTDQCDDLEEYQLNTPDLTVEVEDSDGNRQSLVIGMESVSGGGRYAYCGDSSKIYILSTSIYTSFDYTSGQIMETADFPAVTADYVTGLKIEAKKGKDFQVVYDEDNSPYKNISSWAISRPYSQPVAADVDQLQTLFESYSDLNFSEGVAYHAGPADLKKYGLDKPSYKITLDYFRVKGGTDKNSGEVDSSGDVQATDSPADKEKKKVYRTLRLSIGKQNKDKTGYYAQIAGDKGIYLMDSATAESLVEVTPLDFVYQRLYAGYIEDLKAMDIKYNGKTYHVALEWKKAETDEDGTGEDTYTVKVDGKDADKEAFENAYTDINNLPPNGEIDRKVKPESDKAVAEITFHEKKKDVTMCIYPYDGSNFYRVKVDGIMQFVTDMRNADNILENFAALSE